MNIAEQIFSEVQTLSESQAREVLEFVLKIKTRHPAETEARRAAALATLTK